MVFDPLWLRHLYYFWMIAASYSLSLNNKEENQGSMFIVSIFIKKRYFLIKVEICSDLILNECSFNIRNFQVLKQVFFHASHCNIWVVFFQKKVGKFLYLRSDADYFLFFQSFCFLNCLKAMWMFSRVI